MYLTFFVKNYQKLSKNYFTWSTIQRSRSCLYGKELKTIINNFFFNFR